MMFICWKSILYTLCLLLCNAGGYSSMNLRANFNALYHKSFFFIFTVQELTFLFRENSIQDEELRQRASSRASFILEKSAGNTNGSNVGIPLRTSTEGALEPCEHRGQIGNGCLHVKVDVPTVERPLATGYR